ncbi:glucuronyl hydrolase [Fusobacterium varium]|uniref:glycoside hydrolase family 88 protein n=1 Tax=Fusobacterium varium TaxID=856 RepID=UPI000E50BA83|nr:glycoside hydrolase family 88 protein [Fusobacterium varium]RHG37431.1 glucuronyl hydrolase [Fusobacterium varium]
MELKKEIRERFSQKIDLPKEILYGALHEALKKIDANTRTFINTFPRACSTNYIYPGVLNGGEWDDWTSGFWTGILWLAYEITGEERYRKTAFFQIKSYDERITNKVAVNHHDLGFLYTPSVVAGYKITGNERAKNIGLKAADHLIKRYKEKGEFIQAWGDLDDPTAYRLIIDCNLNVPLLFWTTEVTGDLKYREIATKHLYTAASVVVREDSSTHHTFYFDPETGKPVKGITAQGASDNSAWARGQAWGIYGFSLAYSYLKDEKFIDLFKSVTNYFLNHLPEDNICCWDLIFDEASGEERDTSSAVIAVCGILEMVKYLPDSDPDKKIYLNAVKAIIKSLIKNYTTKDIDSSNGLLTDSVYSKPNGSGVNECCMWGDYFYMEALVRIMKPEWRKYW